MLAIARALMSRPRLLLLDEPSLGLAPLVVKQIFEVIARPQQARGPDGLPRRAERLSCAEARASRLRHGQRDDHHAGRRRGAAGAAGSARRLSRGRPLMAGILWADSPYGLLTFVAHHAHPRRPRRLGGGPRLGSDLAADADDAALYARSSPPACASCTMRSMARRCSRCTTSLSPTSGRRSWRRWATGRSAPRQMATQYSWAYRARRLELARQGRRLKMRSSSIDGLTFFKVTLSRKQESIRPQGGRASAAGGLREGPAPQLQGVTG